MKGNRATEDIVKKIIDLKNEGINYHEIGKRLNIKPTFARQTYNKYVKNTTPAPSGWGKNPSPEDMAIMKAVITMRWSI